MQGHTGARPSSLSLPTTQYDRLVVAKSSSFSEIDNATKTILNVLHEIGNHKKLCAKFGVTVEELETAPESIATTSYGAYLIDCGLRGACVLMSSKCMLT